MTSSEQLLPNHSILPLGSPNKLAWMLGVPIKELQKIAVDSERLYQPFSKKTGTKERIIHNPVSSLKKVQTKINERILHKFEFPEFIVGGIKGKQLEDHVSLHVRKPIVVTLDIKDFFPSISYKKVYAAYTNRLEAGPDVARLMTMLTTYKGSVPLGAPTSTLLASIVLLPCLQKVKVFVENEAFDMTQFVDDTAISGQKLPEDLIKTICKIFSQDGFTISRKKIAVMPSSRSQRVTKRIVNQKVGITRKEINRIRSAVNELKSTPKDHGLYAKKCASLKGRIASIKPYNATIAAKFLEEIL